jgi:DNA-binding NarL/FixJ family response regulator
VIAPRATASPDPPSRPIKVLIVVADHRVRESMADVLGLSPGLTIVGTASHQGAGVAAVTQLQPDVVIVDPRLPDVDAGLALVAVIRQIEPGARILLMSWSIEHENADLAASVDRIIDRCAPPDDLVTAIGDVARSGTRPMLDSAAARARTAQS